MLSRAWPALILLALMAGAGEAAAQGRPFPQVRAAQVRPTFGPSRPARPPEPSAAPRPTGLPRDISDPRALREPVRLTAGASSDLMGVLAPDEGALYFVSDADGTMDIMLQAPVQSAPVAFSSGLGDAAWPQISPDGKQLAYLYFENDSTGDVCVRSISGRAAGAPRCLTGSSSAELQVLWWDDSSLAVLSRRHLHGDFALSRLPLDGGPPAPLVSRNMISLALSPDRRWIAYIPVTRAGGDAGITFSQRVGAGITLERLGAGSEGAPASYLPPLPGVTGAVAFTHDGTQLLFTQFLNDTNGDGAIDGDDNAVIFRVPFVGGRASPIPPATEPEQLTSAGWDCHYPAASPTRLIVSCSHEGSLDVYTLPLDGAVPRGWNDARVAAEAAVARDLRTRLLLLSRRLGLASNDSSREAILIEMIVTHLELGEHESAIYYAEQRLSSARGKLYAQLSHHRRADLALIHGETSEAYVVAEQARARALRAGLDSATPSDAALGRLIISEIEEDIGDKAAALATFREVEIAQIDEPHVATFAAHHAERLYRLRADRQSLLNVYRICAGLPGSSSAERLAHAERFVRELARGRGPEEQRIAIGEARARVEDGSELALLLDAEVALLPLNDANQEAVRARIFELYRENEDPARRRALVLATLQSAARSGNEYLAYQFVTTWASSLRRTDPERKNAEALYDSVVLDRAYGESRRGRTSEARGYFYGATVATESLEAHIGFIEARLAEGGDDAEDDLDAVYTKRFARDPESPVRRFAEAYRLARELPRQTDAELHDRDVQRVVDALARVAEELPKQSQVHQLWGFALHQRAWRSGSADAAAAANRQYLLALDLARDDERLSAALLHRLGLLQASLGGHGLALRHLQQRDDLPHVRPLEELGLRLALAQSAWHRSDGALAKDQTVAAMKLLGAHPDLRHLEPLVLDRLALSLAAAGDRAAARQRYGELAHRLDADPNATPINLLKAQVGLASNALAIGEPEVALQALARADRVLDDSDELDPPPAVVWRRSLIGNYEYAPVQYRALVTGLRRVAQHSLGQHEEARASSEQRVELLGERLRQSGADEDRLELAQAEHQLARADYRVGDRRAAARAVERGLSLSDDFNANTGSPITEAELALLRAYAELHLYAGVPADDLERDLSADLERAYAAICEQRNPRWAEQRFFFKAYLTQLALRREPPRPRENDDE